MATPKKSVSPSAPKRRRADAERSIVAIIDAAIEALASDPDVSMAEIARQAGVVRATIYMHFPTRDSLLDAVMDHTIADVTAAVAAAEPEKGEPREALERLLKETWRKLDRLHTIISLNMARLSSEEFHRRHLPAIQALAPVIVRGQKKGVVRKDVPPSWHLSMVLALVHAASGEVRAGRITDEAAEAAMLVTILNAVSARL